MAQSFNPLIAVFSRIEELLRGERTQSVDTKPARLWHLLGILAIAGCWYGAVMGAFSGGNLPRLAQIVCSAAKVPILLVATFAISLPSFFVLNTLLGLRDDFHICTQALCGSQAVLTVILASLAPLTALWYVSVPDYHDAVLFNAGMFSLASAGAQWALRRDYRPLVARNPRHQWMLRAWLATYAFVGIEMGWVLRPFIGDPATPTTFFRKGAFTNAYIFVAHLILGKLR